MHWMPRVHFPDCHHPPRRSCCASPATSADPRLGHHGDRVPHTTGSETVHHTGRELARLLPATPERAPNEPGRTRCAHQHRTTYAVRHRRPHRPATPGHVERLEDDDRVAQRGAAQQVEPLAIRDDRDDIALARSIRPVILGAPAPSRQVIVPRRATPAAEDDELIASDGDALFHARCGPLPRQRHPDAPQRAHPSMAIRRRVVHLGAAGQLQRVAAQPPIPATEPQRELGKATPDIAARVVAEHVRREPSTGRDVTATGNQYPVAPLHDRRSRVRPRRGHRGKRCPAIGTRVVGPGIGKVNRRDVVALLATEEQDPAIASDGRSIATRDRHGRPRPPRRRSRQQLPHLAPIGGAVAAPSTGVVQGIAQRDQRTAAPRLGKRRTWHPASESSI